MKRLLIAALTICIGTSLSAQDDKNLVTNPSFESVSGKVKKDKQIDKAEDWESPTGQKADLYLGKVKEIVGTPSNLHGNESPLDGENYAGIVAYAYGDKIPRTYLQTELLGPLKKGIQYCVKFNVSLGDKSKYSANNLGAFVTQKRFEVEGKNSIIFDSPKEKDKVVLHPENNTYDGRFNWEQVCNVFTASGKERFLIIGNFFNTKDTKWKKLKKPADFRGTQEAMAYYYIDQVELFVLDSIQECDCIKKDPGAANRVLYHKQVTAEGGMTVEQSIKYSNIYFDWTKATIDGSMKPDLDHLAEILLDSTGMNLNLTVEGYIGSEEFTEVEKSAYLKGLDKKRAEAVVNYLVEKGVARDRFIILPKGKDPLANEGGEEYQKAQNRRVEFKIQ